MMISRIFQVNDLILYERDRKGATYVPKYVVFDESTGRFLEEFRRKDRAAAWLQNEAKSRARGGQK